MKIVGFVEGARTKNGGIGIPASLWIQKALAARGHTVTLLVGGTLGGAFAAEELSTLKVTQAPAFSKWAFAPALIMRARREVASADFVILHSLYSFPVLIGFLLAKWYGKPCGMWPHGVLAPFQRRVGRYKKALYGWLISRRLLREIEVLFFSSEGERDEAAILQLKPFPAVTPQGVNTLNIGPSVSRGDFRRRHLQGHAGPVLLFLGRINQKKGIELLIAAMGALAKRHPDMVLAIAGAGDPPKYECRIRRLVAEAGLADRIAFVGLLTGSAKEEALLDADVFVLPSHAENFGHAVFEALSVGLAVVITDTLNYAPELEKRGAAMVARHDVRSLTEAIHEVLTNDERRSSLTAKGKEFTSQLTWDECARAVESAVKTVIQERIS